MEEVWKSIDGFENYMVSNYGRIKDLNYGNRREERILNTSEKVSLKINNKRLYKNISSIVVRAFIKDCPKEDIVVINIDGDKKNNHVNNLKVMTKKEYGEISAEKYINSVDRDKLEKDFIYKFNSLHGDKWEYVGGYTNSRNPIIIKCKICGSEINIIPDNSLRKTAKLKCNKCEAIKYINDFKFKFNNKYKDKYEYIDREYNSNAFTEDTHIIKCLKCGQLIKRKGKTLLYSKFNCKCQIKHTKHTKRTIDYNKLELKFVDKFNKRYGEYFEYLGGYKEGKIICKCKVCGDIKERVNNKLFDKDRNISCRKCGNNYIGSEIKECIECGKEFTAFNKQQIMCRDCHDKQKKEKRKTLKRLREAKAKKNGKIEWNISLEKLIQRDEGICKICGRQVDINDYYYTDEGYFIAGDNYPSIDHIIPLAKGGTHTWDNIQLAHRHCNSIKSDDIIEQEEEQLKWI